MYSSSRIATVAMDAEIGDTEDLYGRCIGIQLDQWYIVVNIEIMLSSLTIVFSCECFRDVSGDSRVFPSSWL